MQEVLIGGMKCCFVVFNISVLYQKDKEKDNSLCVWGCYCCSSIGNIGAWLLNKCQERRQNDVVMRVERLHNMMEMEYACHLRSVMMYSDQRECMNIIRIYE